MHKVKSLSRITVNLVIANITHYQPMTYNGHYRRNQTAPEFLREIVWCGFRATGNVFILCYLQAGIDFKLIHHS